MKPRPPRFPAPTIEPRAKHRTSAETQARLLEFVRAKFYPGERGGKAFLQDRPRLRAWVLLWPASWLRERGWSLPGERYESLLKSIFTTALLHGETESIGYMPAYLRQVVQSHFRIHEESIGNEAKAHARADVLARPMAMLERIAAGGAMPPQRRDVVEDMAAARDVLALPIRRGAKPGDKGQLTLL